jgi:RNA polymerase sigma-70 factor (ECF subfamily)
VDLSNRVNRTRNFLKSPKNRRHRSLNDLDAGVENDKELVALISENTPRREVKLAELQEKLNEALQGLSDVHRAVVVMHDIQGMPHDEIAGILDCNTGTVRTRLFYARQQLQGMLADYLK